VAWFAEAYWPQQPRPNDTEEHTTKRGCSAPLRKPRHPYRNVPFVVNLLVAGALRKMAESGRIGQFRARAGPKGPSRLGNGPQSGPNRGGHAYQVMGAKMI